uniref:Uncharacterized protein n=1 Tax=Setaria italica TaxID=4555 RepID=K4AHH9_SETIT
MANFQFCIISPSVERDNLSLGEFRRISCCLAVAQIGFHRRRPGQSLAATGHPCPLLRCRVTAIHRRRWPCMDEIINKT